MEVIHIFSPLIFSLLQSNEVQSSYHMELEGYKRVVGNLSDKGLTIGKLVTDRHRQLAKYVREACPEIIHMYDVWHVAKGKCEHFCSVRVNCISLIQMYAQKLYAKKKKMMNI